MLPEDSDEITASCAPAEPSEFWNSKAVVIGTGCETLTDRKDWIGLNGIGR